jgi:hypothetical protein
MGEYGLVGGERVKLGTCEDMYYLRADQVGLVTAEQGSLDPADPEVQAEIRFRFPWPDEDGVQPGAFDPFYRAVGVYGVQPPTGVEHRSVQFVAQAGYLVSLPCPEGPFQDKTGAPIGLIVHRNGFPGPVKIVQQAYRGGNLAVICQCGGCGARYNLPTLVEAEPVIVACRAKADQLAHQHRVGAHRDTPMDGAVAWWHGVADRIAAGYKQDAAA